MKIRYTQLLMATIAILCAFSATAQNSDTLELQKNENGKIAFGRFKPNESNKVKDGNIFLKKVLNAKANDEFKLYKDTTDKLGITHNRYNQYYKGIKVDGHEYLVHGKNGLIETINGNFADVNIKTVTPAITEATALSKALSFVDAKKYKWEDPTLEKFAKQNSGNPKATYYPKGELIITKDYLKGSNSFKLSWMFTISIAVPNDEQLIYIDAMNGDVINQKSLIFDANVGCEGPLRYWGLQGFMGDSYPGGIRLRELRYTVNISTLNLHGTSNYANATEFQNNDIHFTQSTWPAFAQDQPALDAHVGEEMVLDYLKVVFGRNSIDGNGLPVTGYVHYFDPNSPAGWPNQAQWDGNNHVMRYGDGDRINFNPFTSLDMCAHEMGHGITQFTSNISQGTSGHDEANALNEGLSDIWGACVEHRSAPDKQTWRFAEDIIAAAGFNCIRDLQNPKSTTALEGQHPNTYLREFWSTTGEPHINSTVLSHWFFLLCQGGSGTNDIPNTFSVCPIGIDAAQSIVYEAEINWLHAGANYAAARNAMISASTKLYGANSSQTINVTNAWHAVGVGARYTGDAGLTVSGNSSFCTSATYTVNAPAGSAVAWSATSGIVNINAATGSATKVSNGSALITASVTTCPGTSFTVSKRVSVGIPNNYYIQRMSMVSTNRLDIYPSFSGQQLSVTSWNVYVDGSFSTSGSGYPPSVISVYASSGSHSITLTTYNSCGSYSTSSSYSGYSHYAITPNPANGNVTITDKAANSKSALTGGKVTITVFDNTNRPLKQFSFSQSSRYNFSVANLTPGIYIVQIKQNGSVSSVKLIKQ